VELKSDRLIALVSLPLLWVSVKRAQLAYAVMGSFFMPLLALTLLILNNRHRRTSRGFANGWVTNAALAATLAFFVYVGLRKASESVLRLTEHHVSFDHTATSPSVLKAAAGQLTETGVACTDRNRTISLMPQAAHVPMHRDSVTMAATSRE